MKKFLSCLTVVALSFTSISSTLAAPNSSAQTSTKVTSKNKEARMLVEADIIKMQKDAVEMTRSLLQTYLKSETTESGNMKWEFTAKDSDYEVKVNTDIEKYINIISYLQGKQEF
jgi:hypothetical protein